MAIFPGRQPVPRSSSTTQLPSPCRQICQLDAHDVCIGCARTRKEIGEWSGASVQRQAEILKAVSQRVTAHKVDGPSQT